jgi:hypothetical protein
MYYVANRPGPMSSHHTFSREPDDAPLSVAIPTLTGNMLQRVVHTASRRLFRARQCSLSAGREG